MQRVEKVHAQQIGGQLAVAGDKGGDVAPGYPADRNVEPGDPRHPTRLTLLCRDDRGYRNLCRLLSRAYLEGRRLGQVLAQREWLEPEACAGLIALSAGLEGDIGPDDPGKAASELTGAEAQAGELLLDGLLIEAGTCSAAHVESV